jgi:hypothetical protein
LVKNILRAGSPAAKARPALSKSRSRSGQDTPDPLGDWTNGRNDRLARAELASEGLRA